MPNLTIIGTSHIAKESVREVRRFIREKRPDIVAVELDRRRLHGLLSRHRPKSSFYNIFRVGIQGYLFSLIGAWASRKMGNVVGTDPGADMKAAVLAARKEKLQLALIDQDIEITLRRFSQAFTWREKWQMVKDVFEGIFNKEAAMKKLHGLDLRKVPKDELIERLLEEVRHKYPSLYQVLITERNKVMVNNLKRIMRQYPDRSILAVVGAGHREGMESLLNKVDAISYSFSFS
ncbi:MAG: hypothetical protein GXP63_01265 [DPANN group archaeon]|nr:hypothetical protein [DPANN group archaeon]